MRKLSKSEKLVISSLIHLESMETLIAETGLLYGEVRDDITNLISTRLIEVFEEPADGGMHQRTSFYDLDNLNRYLFRATVRGHVAIKES